VFRITGAPRSHTEDINRRINRYLVSMTIRTVCVVLIFVLHGPARWVAAAGAIFLPWVAVMLANAADRRTSVQLPPVLDHKALTSGASPDPHAPSEVVLEGEVLVGDETGPRDEAGAPHEADPVAGVADDAATAPTARPVAGAGAADPGR
jgi:hypothetical protein